jgi:hypothetical protein
VTSGISGAERRVARRIGEGGPAGHRGCALVSERGRTIPAGLDDRRLGRRWTPWTSAISPRQSSRNSPLSCSAESLVCTTSIGARGRRSRRVRPTDDATSPRRSITSRSTVPGRWRRGLPTASTTRPVFPRRRCSASHAPLPSASGMRGAPRAFGSTARGWRHPDRSA